MKKFFKRLWYKIFHPKTPAITPTTPEVPDVVVPEIPKRHIDLFMLLVRISFLREL